MESLNPALLRWIDKLALRRDCAEPNAMFPPSAAGGEVKISNRIHGWW